MNKEENKGGLSTLKKKILAIKLDKLEEQAKFNGNEIKRQNLLNKELRKLHGLIKNKVTL